MSDGQFQKSGIASFLARHKAKFEDGTMTGRPFERGSFINDAIPTSKEGNNKTENPLVQATGKTTNSVDVTLKSLRTLRNPKKLHKTTKNLSKHKEQ